MSKLLVKLFCLVSCSIYHL